MINPFFLGIFVSFFLKKKKRKFLKTIYEIFILDPIVERFF